MELLDGTPPPLVSITLGRDAWLALETHLYPYEWATVRARLGDATPDAYGRITLDLGEHLAMQVNLAIDDAVLDHLGQDGQA